MGLPTGSIEHIMSTASFGHFIRPCASLFNDAKDSTVNKPEESPRANGRNIMNKEQNRRRK